MDQLKQQHISIPFKTKFRTSKNMTATVRSQSAVAVSEVEKSLYRGELLRYAQYFDAVKDNFKDLKKINPKHLATTLKIIDTSISVLEPVDINVPLDTILKEVCTVSYKNSEALDFTAEVLNHADKLTAKYYLAVVSSGIMQNDNLKQQFSTAIPFVKIILSSLNNCPATEKQESFIKALSVIINENADPKKIELLPKIKYIIDTISKENHNIDVTKILYGNTTAEEINIKLDNLIRTKMLKKKKLDYDCTDYLIKN